MPDTCLVTFTARDSGFAVLPGQTVTFVPTGSLLAGQNTNLLARTTRTVVADGAGAGSVDLVPGTYRLETMGSDGLIAAPIIVPDVLTATIGECLEALAQASVSQMQLALLAATTGRMFETPALGYAAAAVAVGDVFLALNAGVLSVYRKDSPTTGTLLGPLFTSGSFQTGLTVNGLLTGLAVTQSQTDTTARRLLKVGDGGLLGAGPLYTGDVDAITVNGAYRLATGATSTASPVPALGLGMTLIHWNWDGNAANQVLKNPANTRSWLRSRWGGSWGPWRMIFNAGNILGTVSQSGGIPTGAVIERGSNANGEFVRYADGTQICTFTAPAIDCNSATGAMFQTAAASTWTFPAAFTASPAVSGSAGSNVRWLAMGPPTTSAVTYRAMAPGSSSTAVAPTLTAIGRWF